MVHSWRGGMLLAAVLAAAAQEEKDSGDQITKAVHAHFTKYDAARQAEVAKELLDSWKSLPDSGEIRKEGLRRTVRHIEIATHLFQRNELAAPDRFHVRTYDLVLRRMKNYAANSVRFPKRTAEERARILEQLDALFRHAVTEFLACAKDDAAQGLARDRWDGFRREFANAVDDPFTGYVKPLEEIPFRDLRGKITKAAAGVTKMNYDKESPPFTELGLPSRDSRVLPVAVQVMYEITRAHDPVRMEIHDESQALLAEVKTDLAEQRKKAREGGEPK